MVLERALSSQLSTHCIDCWRPPLQSLALGQPWQCNEKILPGFIRTCWNIFCRADVLTLFRLSCHIEVCELLDLFFLYQRFCSSSGLQPYPQIHQIIEWISFVFIDSNHIVVLVRGVRFLCPSCICFSYARSLCPFCFCVSRFPLSSLFHLVYSLQTLARLGRKLMTTLAIVLLFLPWNYVDAICWVQWGW